MSLYNVKRGDVLGVVLNLDTQFRISDTSPPVPLLINKKGMNMSSQKIAVIIGSTRPGRVGDKVASWYLEQVKDIEGATFELIDLAEIKLPLLDEPAPAMMAQYSQDHTKKWSEKIASFDAYVMVTPEYNHSAPASLTNAISYLNQEWKRKPVAFVSYGTMGGVRAVEHLRGIAGELHMADIRPQVSLLQPWALFDESGNVRPELVVGDPKEQIEDLLWWSDTLGSKRNS
jgi:NAD(P)H-dependent FMN reductase